jgi:hypothetical protein
MGLFRKNKEPFAAPLSNDIDKVRGKLQAVDTELAGAEARMRSASLAAALDDDSAGYEVINQVQALRARRQLLLAAIGERIEDERLAACRSREQIARKRSLAQHGGRLASLPLRLKQGKLTRS